MAAVASATHAMNIRNRKDTAAQSYKIGAMSTLKPEQASLLLQTYLSALRAEQPVTQRIIEAIPAAKSDYKPDAVSKSALDLAWHVVGSEKMFLDGVLSGTFDFSAMGKPAEITTPEQMSAWYTQMFEEKTAQIENLSPEQLSGILDFGGIFQLPAVAYLEVSLKHSIHHRGQLSMYLRPMGAKVPSIYGPSYDTAHAATA
jgi:uncharacterized damage-inducible protein DinB